MTMRHNCDGVCYLKTHMWDWAIFENCFGSPRVAPMDIDGIVERNGHFLVIETKSASLNGLPRGQEITYEAMQRTGLFTVLVMFGQRNQPERAFALMPDGTRFDWQRFNVDQAREFAAHWYEFANAQAA